MLEIRLIVKAKLMTLKKKPVNEPWREVFLSIRKAETSGLTRVDQLLFKARFMY